MTFPDRAIRAYIEASRGALHPMLSTDAAYADDVADALTPIGAEMRPFDTGMMHGPVQWLEGQAPSAPARKRLRASAEARVPGGRHDPVRVARRGDPSRVAALRVR
jgi:hypothetical protein